MDSKIALNHTHCQTIPYHWLAQIEKDPIEYFAKKMLDKIFANLTLDQITNISGFYIETIDPRTPVCRWRDVYPYVDFNKISHLADIESVKISIIVKSKS